MNKLNNEDKNKLQNIYKDAAAKYEKYKALNMTFDMTRGKPSAQQLDISMGLLASMDKEDCLTENADYRNYGLVDGIPEAKKLFAEMLEVSPKEIIIGGNSSLNMMYDTIARAMLKGVSGVDTPWSAGPVKFLCPSPGYDRHFAICEDLGIEMIAIEMTESGPDMDKVEALAASDESIKGIWCTPKYSNPGGITYSDEIVDRLASMKTKAKDFRIFWDNAYAVHHLYEKQDQLKNILQACKDAGNEHRVFIFASTSKISFPGAGLAMMASSEANINAVKKQMSVQTIGPDKLNQVRHVKYFKNFKGISDHMKKHAEILRPKFDLVLSTLEEQLGNTNLAQWSKPNGGYFISLDTIDGCASAVIDKAKRAGLLLTPAGSTYPYKKDPKDKNIRIAPSFPSLDELKKAAELLCLCVEIVCIEKLLDEK